MWTHTETRYRKNTKSKTEIQTQEYYKKTENCQIDTDSDAYQLTSAGC